MTEPLKECPCGKVPSTLGVTFNTAGKYAHAVGDCCGHWEIEFQANYATHEELMDLAAEAWNAAPRGGMR